jgi:hypothetical protein
LTIRPFPHIRLDNGVCQRVSEPSSIPSLDLSKIQLPTDRVTLGAIRRRQPELLPSAGIASAKRLSDVQIFCAADAEIALAQKCFADELGLPDPRPNDDVGELKELLGAEYKRWDISSGPTHTEQLLRDLVADAQEQARLLGRKR